MHTLLSFFLSLFLGVQGLFGVHPETLDSSVVATSSSEVTPSTSSEAAPTFNTTSISPSAPSAMLPTGSPWLTTLPLGDNNYVTSAPKKGYIYICHMQSGGQGAQINGPWIHGLTWNPLEKVHVQGAVKWPDATYTMKISAGIRMISSNDLPTDHTTGTFPIAASDPAAAYDRNHGTISAHAYSFTFPAYPSALQNPGCIYGEVGIMNDGVLLFDGFDALYRDALAHELQDAHDGHPNDEGYHKHGFISDIKNVAISQVVGYAFDGYPITGPLLPNGNYLTTNDLDVCHGMTSSIMLDGKTQESYHYVLTQDFPYSVSCFHGTSKITPQTLRAQGLETNSPENTQMPQQAGQGAPPAPPQEAIDACTGKTTGQSCTVGQGMHGTCATIGSVIACKP